MGAHQQATTYRQLADNYVKLCVSRKKEPEVSELAYRLGATEAWIGERFEQETGLKLGDYLKVQHG